MHWEKTPSTRASGCTANFQLISRRRNSLLSCYSVLLLRDYRRIFGSSSEAGQLDNVSRRFAWFRRVLKTHEEENTVVFPAGWNVGAVLAGGFSEVTR